MNNCETCGHPGRVLWTFGHYPKLIKVKSRNYMSLEQCPECGHQWCMVPEEPFGSFPFWVSWPYEQQVFDLLIQKERGLLLHEWHEAMILENWQSLPAFEREYVEQWRNRTGRKHNFIDEHLNKERRPKKYIEKSWDIEKFAINIYQNFRN